jgi:transcriptional regulator with XRE-family HTH domain
LIKVDEFGGNVRRIRQTLGLTIAELAKKSKMTSAAISQIECGKRDPQLRSVISIAEALGVKLTKLLKGA